MIGAWSKSCAVLRKVLRKVLHSLAQSLAQSCCTVIPSFGIKTSPDGMQCWREQTRIETWKSIDLYLSVQEKALMRTWTQKSESGQSDSKNDLTAREQKNRQTHTDLIATR